MHCIFKTSCTCWQWGFWPSLCHQQSCHRRSWGRHWSHRQWWRRSQSPSSWPAWMATPTSEICKAFVQLLKFKYRAFNTKLMIFFFFFLQGDYSALEHTYMHTHIACTCTHTHTCAHKHKCAQRHTQTLVAGGGENKWSLFFLLCVCVCVPVHVCACPCPKHFLHPKYLFNTYTCSLSLVPMGSSPCSSNIPFIQLFTFYFFNNFFWLTLCFALIYIIWDIAYMEDWSIKMLSLSLSLSLSLCAMT